MCLLIVGVQVERGDEVVVVTTNPFSDFRWVKGEWAWSVFWELGAWVLVVGWGWARLGSWGYHLRHC